METVMKQETGRIWASVSDGKLAWLLKYLAIPEDEFD
jgi:hypothetical protein